MFTKIHKKILVTRSIFNKVVGQTCNFIKKKTKTKKYFFLGTFRATASTHLQFAEAVTRRCSVKKVFLKISQNSEENTCIRVSF